MLLVLLACNTDVQVATQSDPALVPAQERLGLTDAEVKQILAFLNRCDTTFDLLDSVVGLDSDAAENLVNTRDGADAECGTNDDGTYLTLDDVDAVPQVGDKTILEVLAYIEEGQDGDGTWEGVTFSAEEQEVVLEIANDASLSVLDEDVGLASDEAGNIVDARPIASLGELADVAQIGESAMQKLKDYVPRWGG